MTVGELRELIADEPDDTELIMVEEGTWVSVTKAEFIEAQYSAGPDKPVQRTSRELAFS